MMDQPMIQPHLIDQYQRLAELENRPLEEVVNQALENEIDKRLWAIVDQRLSPEDDVRLHELMPRNNDGRLSGNEKAELDRLVRLVNEQMLQRSEALYLLQQRGHEIVSHLKSGLGNDDP